MNSRKTTYLLFTGLILAGVLGFAFAPQIAFSSPADIDISNFNPGRIIDDHIFTDTSTMTVEEIQSFLEATVEDGQCDRYRENIYGGFHNHNGPYTCLFEFQQNIETGANNYGLFDEDGAPSNIEGGLTSAEIIWQKTQEYRINPQVLLVLLQKEQSLITDNWPWLGQYARATGYHCPDTAPCNPTTADFYKQVAGAAWQFRRYLDYIDEYWYVLGENNILYNPNPDCGYQFVNIQNEATIALYLYTPYVPNQAALNNLFGYGNSCSAYGNRNFWAYFHRWFGPTIDENRHILINEEEETGESPSETENNTDQEEKWSFEFFFQGFYTDPNREAAIDTVVNKLKSKQTVYVVLNVKNTGTTTWTQVAGNKQVVLAVAETEGQSDPNRVCHPNWQDNCQQVTLLHQTEVHPNEMATFEFEILTPSFNGQFIESFAPKSNNDYLEGEPVEMIFNVVGGGNRVEIMNEDTSTNSDIEEEIATHNTESSQVASNTVVLPTNWHGLSVIEKIRLNPWGCHDTTQIRADNGRCLSGGYTVPSQIASRPSQPTVTTAAIPPATSQVASNTVVLPTNWHGLSVIEKIRLNPWGCHDTTQIRADNGRCLSGGYTVPSQIASRPSQPTVTTAAIPPATSQVASNTVVLPTNWHGLSVIEKIRLNPWGCHDTTQIRADNGRCLSGGYTVPIA